jgi:hypothetical protein
LSKGIVAIDRIKQRTLRILRQVYQTLNKISWKRKKKQGGNDVILIAIPPVEEKTAILNL